MLKSVSLQDWNYEEDGTPPCFPLFLLIKICHVSEDLSLYTKILDNFNNLEPFPEITFG